LISVVFCLITLLVLIFTKSYENIQVSNGGNCVTILEKFKFSRESFSLVQFSGFRSTLY
jgi:hypothetical protein